MSPDIVLIHTEGFTARDELVALAHRKVEKLFRHGDRLVRVRLNIAREAPRSGAEWFAATARLERAGRDAVTHAFGETPEAVVHEAVEKLERMIAARVGARKHAVHHPRAVELAAALPKT
jgi:putative sigma-54 modulation protein